MSQASFPLNGCNEQVSVINGRIIVYGIVLFKKINELFPNGEPSTDIDERNKVIESWDDGQYDDLFESLDERFYNELEEELEMKLDEVVKRLIS